MTSRENRCVVLNGRPIGVPGPEFFDVVTRPVTDLQDGEFLIHNAYLSVDPAQRGWTNDAPNYSPPVPIGDVMRASAVGKVVESRHANYAVGDTVTGRFGWQRFAVSHGGDVLRKLAPTEENPSRALGVVGINGLSAYFGLLDLCAPQAGETVVVSTAAGAVGSCVGQIAKLKGCRTSVLRAAPRRFANAWKNSNTTMQSTTRIRRISAPNLRRPARMESMSISTIPAGRSATPCFGIWRSAHGSRSVAQQAFRHGTRCRPARASTASSWSPARE